MAKTTNKNCWVFPIPCERMTASPQIESGTFLGGVGLFMSSPARNGVLDGLLVGSHCMVRLVFDHLSRSLRAIPFLHIPAANFEFFCVALSFR